MDKICFIVGAGEVGEMNIPSKPEERRRSLVIAVDGGLAHLEERGIIPDLVVGDFDSLGRVPQNYDDIRIFPAEKDDTDMMIAVSEGLKAGCKKLMIYGGLGGRIGHTMANMQILKHISQKNAAGYLLGTDGTTVTVIRNSSLDFSDDLEGYITILSAEDTSEGVTIEGLKYCVEDIVMTGDYPLGTSNEFTGSCANVSVKNGSLAIMWNEKDVHLLQRIQSK